MTMFVDANHAGSLLTRRSQTGILLFLNKAPIVWYSKRQNTVESSIFGSELVALRTGVEMVKSLRWKLRMMGITIDGATDILVNNESMANSVSIPEGTLTKKHNAICWHLVREACAAKYIRVAWEPTDSNLADLFTKVLPVPRRETLISQIVY